MASSFWKPATTRMMSGRVASVNSEVIATAAVSVKPATALSRKLPSTLMATAVVLLMGFFLNANWTFGRTR